MSSLAASLEQLQLEHERNRGLRSFSEVKEFAVDLGLAEVAGMTCVIGGTNGKGTVTHYMEQILHESGYKVGCTTSPHLSRVTERVRTERKEIDETQFAELIHELLSLSHRPAMTYFDILTLAALTHFKRTDVAIALLEVGLGGRLDTTNIVDRSLSVITNVSVDHQRILGDSRDQIAKEKAGMLQAGVPLLFGERDIPQPIKKHAHRLKCPILTPDQANRPSEFPRPSIDLRTDSQQAYSNRDIAYSAVNTLIGGDGSQPPLNSYLCKPPGRLELVEKLDQKWLLDVAHNEASVSYLSRFIERKFPDQQIVTLFACLRDKKVDAMLTLLQQISKEVILTRTEHARGLSHQESEFYSDLYNISYIPSLHAAHAFLRESVSTEAVIVVCGSFELVGEIRSMLLTPSEQHM